MALGRNIIINWLIKSKAIKDDERELYEYALKGITVPREARDMHGHVLWGRLY